MFEFVQSRRQRWALELNGVQQRSDECVRYRQLRRPTREEDVGKVVAGIENSYLAQSGIAMTHKYLGMKRRRFDSQFSQRVDISETVTQKIIEISTYLVERINLVRHISKQEFHAKERSLLIRVSGLFTFIFILLRFVCAFWLERWCYIGDFLQYNVGIV